MLWRNNDNRCQKSFNAVGDNLECLSNLCKRYEEIKASRSSYENYSRINLSNTVLVAVIYDTINNIVVNSHILSSVIIVRFTQNYPVISLLIITTLITGTARINALLS